MGKQLITGKTRLSKGKTQSHTGGRQPIRDTIRQNPKFEATVRAIEACEKGKKERMRAKKLKRKQARIERIHQRIKECGGESI